MSSVLYSNNPTEWRLTDAVVIDEQDQPAAPRFSGVQRTAHLVGQFPWGPADTLIEVRSASDLTQLFGQATDLASYGGYRALTGKRWGVLEIVRVEADDAAAATRILADSIPTNAYTVTAKYKSAAGNQISVKHTKIDANTFDVEVKWGTKIETFEGVTFDAAGMSSIDSEWVTFALHGDSGANPDSDADFVALAGGDNGTLVDLNWTGSDVSDQGLRILRSGSDGGVWFAAEFTSAAWLTELRAAVDVKRGHAFAQPSTADDFDSNETAAEAVADERLVLFGHRVLQTINGTQYTVDLVAFAASVYVNTPPNLSLAEDRWSEYLTTIDGLPAGVELSREYWVAADAAGMNMLERRDTGGFRFHMAITSDPAAGKTSFIRRRMTDFVNDNIASALQPYRNKAPIPAHRRGALRAQIQRLQLMKGSDDVPDSQMVEAFSVNESASDASSVEYLVKVKLWGEMRYLIAHVQVGENVNIEEG